MKYHVAPWISGLAIAAAASLALPAQATTVIAVPLERMTDESEVIVHARVGTQQVTWDEHHARILTLTTIEVIEAVRGASKGDVLTIYQVGGSLDGYTFKIPGALRFEPGEEMVFFAMRFEDKLVSYGMGLGKYHVDEHDGDKLVWPEYGSVVFVERKPDGSVAPGPPPEMRARSLDELLTLLRQQISTAPRGGVR